MGFVHPVHEHGEVGLAQVENGTKSTVTLRRQEIPLLEVDYIGEGRRLGTEIEVRSDVDGELFVYVGIWGTSAFLRMYYLDNVQVATGLLQLLQHHAGVAEG